MELKILTKCYSALVFLHVYYIYDGHAIFRSELEPLFPTFLASLF
jgi:hypothetical protein